MVLKEPKLAASVSVPVVADGVLLLAYVHELGGDPPLLLALPHQPLHKHLLTLLLLYQWGNNMQMGPSWKTLDSSAVFWSLETRLGKDVYSLV